MEQEENIIETTPIVEEKKPKKKHRLLKGLLIFIIVIGIIVIALGSIFPGLLWTKSLGIRYTQADYESIMNKLNYTKDETPTSGEREDYEYVFGEVTNVDIEFTSEEITAFFNEERPDYYAIKNVQVRINDDGSIEATASANVDYFLKEVLGNEFSREEIKQELIGIDLLPTNINLYLKFSGSVTNNQSSINFESATVQGIPIPDEYIKSSEARNTVTEGLNDIMNEYKTTTGANFEKIAVENSKIIFKGKVPTTLTRTER